MSDVPLARGKVAMAKPPKATAAQIGESESDDEALTEKLAKKKQQIQKSAERTAKALNGDSTPAKKRKPKKVDSEDDDDVPLAKKKKAAATPTPIKKEKSKVKAPAAPSGKETKSKVKAPIEDDEEDDLDEDENRWWENMNKDNTIKWKTLEHNGVVFPPEYKPLPKNVKLVYDGKPVSLPPESEEIAGFYGAMLNSEVNVSNPTFNKNFFRDFRAVLDKTGHGKDREGNTVKIKEFEKCDFKPIFEYYNNEREKKKALPAAEKKKLKAEKDEAEAPYLYCMWDGRKQKVGNFRVEPPGLFRGRGEHPKTGMVKTGTWLAMWQENINNAYKYVMLAASSDIKGQSDYTKFEKARELRKHINTIRKDYRLELKDKVMANRQRATAMYFIDQLALRAGNEKGDDEADTVGCCSNALMSPCNPPTSSSLTFSARTASLSDRQFMWTSRCSRTSRSSRRTRKIQTKFSTDLRHRRSTNTCRATCKA
jgi:DNA topoisomerase I